jgi:hypothetical protein
MGKWKFLKSIYVYLGYRAMKRGEAGGEALLEHEIFSCVVGKV